MLRLCQGIFGTGKVVILDSGFCVLRGIVELAKHGVYASALIKKRKYWPKFINGDEVNHHFLNKQIGECDRLNGKLDGTDFSLMVFKEPEYNMMLMSTYSFLEVPQDAKEKIRKVGDETIKFRYKEPFFNHFQFRDTVDNHNALRHSYGIDSTIGIEHTFKTHRWEIRVFCFILALIEVNVYLARKYFLSIEEEFVDFRKRMAFKLMNVKAETEEDERAVTRQRVRRIEHQLITPPAHCKWNGEKWVKCHKRPYQQLRCAGILCFQRTRTMCVCNRAIYWCANCYAEHRVDDELGPS